MRRRVPAVLMRAAWMGLGLWPLATAGGLPPAWAAAAAVLPVLWAGLLLLSPVLAGISLAILAGGWLALDRSPLPGIPPAMPGTGLLPWLVMGSGAAVLLALRRDSLRGDYGLLGAGLLVQVVTHARLGAPMTVPLLAFSLSGVSLIAARRLAAFRSAPPGLRPRRWLLAAAPLAAGAAALLPPGLPGPPPAPPVPAGSPNLLQVPFGHVVPDRGRPRRFSRRPLLLVRSPTPVYLTGGVYTTFTGLAWTNPAGPGPYPAAGGPGGIFPAAIPAGPGRLLTVRVLDLQPGPLGELPYPGRPLRIRTDPPAPVVADPTSRRLLTEAVRAYTVEADWPVPDGSRLESAAGPPPEALAPDLE
ncbi:MAG: hypothetical protein OWV35_08055, partial [Firmicutes bacterium]|nr:hypothetical protein [Bacillota bacterium]